MAERSHRDEMNAAIRAQRERRAAPRTMAADEPASHPAPVAARAAEASTQPEPRKSMLDRLRRR